MLAYMILCGRLPFGTEKASVSVADLYSGGVEHSMQAGSARAQPHGGVGKCLPMSQLRTPERGHLPVQGA